MTDAFRFVGRFLAAIILILFCWHHSLDLVKQSRREFKQPADPDSVASFEGRFAGLKMDLSRSGSAEVGYVTDIPESDGNWFWEYYRTQYTLAPIVVDNSLKPSMIVAKLRDPASIGRLLRDNQLSLVSDYGNGVVLLSRQPK